MYRVALFLAVFALPISAEVIELQGCEHDALYGVLDFCLGDWDVYAGNSLVGTNTEVSMDEGATWRSVFDAE